jgi:hypothetical protein
MTAEGLSDRFAELQHEFGALKGEIASRKLIDDVAQKLEALREDLGALRAETAARKPVEDIVKYLLYFWLSLSAILGLFGWKQLSDIEGSISNEVTRQLPKDSEKYRNYETLITDTKKLYADFESLTKNYKTRVDELKYADILSSDFDMEGQINNIIVESDEEGKLQDNAWRAKAISTIQKFQKFVGSKAVPADLVFNVAQVCRQLKALQLAQEMTTAAFSKDPSPAIQALKLSSEVANSTGKERDVAFAGLMDMVRSLDSQSDPQIVLAEAWNAAENRRKYDPLIGAIDEYVAAHRKSGESIPSYVFAIKAQALLRRSFPRDVELARQALKEGRELFAVESPLAQWHSSFVRDFRKLSAAIDTSNEPQLSGRGAGRESLASEQLLKMLLEASQSRRENRPPSSP